MCMLLYSLAGRRGICGPGRDGSLLRRLVFLGSWSIFGGRIGGRRRTLR